MGREEQLLLQLLQDHLHGRRTALPEDTFDWDHFCRLVRNQYIGGIAYCQLRSGMPQDHPAREQLHERFMAEVFHHVCYRDEYGTVMQALHEGGVAVAPMKGIRLSALYPEPALRCMGDIDLVIRPADRMRCHEIMTGLGFRCSRDLHEVWTYTRDVVSFEIHDWMMYQNLASDFDYRTYFSTVWDHVSEGEGNGYAIDPSYHFLFLIVHLAKHALNAGCGFRNYMDLVLVCRSETLDLPWIEEELKRMGLWKFAGVCFALCERWFDVKLPLDAPRPDAQFLQIATEKTIRDGAFGLKNTENETGGTVKVLKRAGGAYWKNALKMAVRFLFPSYRNMELIPQYAFVSGRPWLLPAAWIYRICYCIKHKLFRSFGRLLEPFTRRREIAERTDLMDQWGL